LVLSFLSSVFYVVSITSSFLGTRTTKMLKLKLLLFQLLILIATFSFPLALCNHHEAIQSLLHRLDSKRAVPSVQESAARGVLKRLLPTHFSSFEFNIISKVVSLFPFFTSFFLILSSILCLTLFFCYPFLSFHLIFGF